MNKRKHKAMKEARDEKAVKAAEEKFRQYVQKIENSKRIEREKRRLEYRELIDPFLKMIDETGLVYPNSKIAWGRPENSFDMQPVAYNLQYIPNCKLIVQVDEDYDGFSDHLSNFLILEVRTPKNYGLEKRIDFIEFLTLANLTTTIQELIINAITKEKIHETHDYFEKFAEFVRQI